MESLDKGIVENLDAGLKCFGLTPREIQILRQLALGKGDKQISIDLLISVKTVNHHVSNIILKLDTKNRTHAVAKALLTRQIVMRVTDAPARIPNRRLGDQDRTARVIANYMYASLGRRMRGPEGEDLPEHPFEDQIESESPI